MYNNSSTLAVFIDNANMYISIKKDGWHFDPIQLCRVLQRDYGNIVLGRSYWGITDNDIIPAYKINKLYEEGVEIIPVPTYHGKNLADGKMFIDIIHYLDRYTEIDIWILITNDKDFLPILEELRRKNKEVILVHSQEIRIMMNACDHMAITRVLYQDIIPNSKEFQ